MMPKLLTYREALGTGNGHHYTALACGQPREDGTWEGWLEFVPEHGSEVVRTPRETTQANAAELHTWATRLTSSDLSGALQRALHSSDGHDD
jgi:hypothetical protein